jgi:hypothetical protein
LFAYGRELRELSFLVIFDKNSDSVFCELTSILWMKESIDKTKQFLRQSEDVSLSITSLVKNVYLKSLSNLLKSYHLIMLTVGIISKVCFSGLGLMESLKVKWIDKIKSHYKHIRKNFHLIPTLKQRNELINCLI